MLFMVIEHFNQGAAPDVYRAVRERGRQLPEGLVYVDSWVKANLQRCFQLMTCEDARLLQELVLHWCEFGSFETMPVVQSRDTVEVVNRFLATESG